MSKIAGTAALTIAMALAPAWQGQEAYRDACIQRCVTRCVTQSPDFELQRQEIISLEKEATRAIQQNSGTFFHRVYAEDYAGTLSHGQQVNKTQWIDTIESPSLKYESFNASDIRVHIFQDTAVATCLWSSRFIYRGQHVSTQIRAIHVYVNAANGWRVVSGQSTNLPPDIQQPL
jgi:ketosteroid isomerase-like protein